MTRITLACLIVSSVAVGPSFGQADDTPQSGAKGLIEAYRKKNEYIMQIRRENEAKMARLEGEIEKLDKELVGFETGKEFQPALKNTIFERYSKERERLRNAVLANPEEVKGQIETGRALNVMLVAMGDKIRHQRFVKSSGDPNFDKFRKMTAELMTLSGEDSKLIGIRTNNAGEKLTLAIGADHPLKFSLLPTLLRREPFKELMLKLERTGDKALDELRSGEPVSAETEADMLEKMNEVVGAYRKFVRDIRKSGDLNDFSAALRSQAFVTNLKGTVRIFTEASTLREIQAPAFAGGPFDDLLLHMTSHNLRFGPATNQRQRELYGRLFHAMRLYFYDLALMERLRVSSQEELAALQNEQKALTTSLYDGRNEERLNEALRHEHGIEMWSAIKQALLLQGAGIAPVMPDPPGLVPPAPEPNGGLAPPDK